MTDKSAIITNKGVELEKLFMELREDGILHFTVKDNVDFYDTDIKKTNEAIKKLGNGKAFCNLITLAINTNYDKSAREYAASVESNMYTIADAMVTSNFAIKLMFNFYMNFNKPIKPTKLFLTEESAIKWLRKFNQE